MLSVNVLNEKKKFDGSVNSLAEAKAGDSTGVVSLIIRNGKPATPPPYHSSFEPDIFSFFRALRYANCLM